MPGRMQPWFRNADRAAAMKAMIWPRARVKDAPLTKETPKPLLEVGVACSSGT